MDEVRAEIWESSPGAALASGLLFLLAVLTVSLIAPATSMAHPLKSPEITAKAVNADDPSDPVTQDGSPPSGLGGGCSIAGLDVPGHPVPAQAGGTGKVRCPMTTQPILDIARAPPSPPPIEGLRFQTD
jgi:hypothetical protein